jgi:hypothetical protein
MINSILTTIAYLISDKPDEERLAVMSAELPQAVAYFSPTSPQGGQIYIDLRRVKPNEISKVLAHELAHVSIWLDNPGRGYREDDESFLKVVSDLGGVKDYTELGDPSIGEAVTKVELLDLLESML